MTIYNDLRLKAMVRKVSNMYQYSNDDKILAYISMFDSEPKKYHNQIKNYINEFAPDIWKDFAIEDTKETMANIIKGCENDNSSEESSTLADLLKKIK